MGNQVRAEIPHAGPVISARNSEQKPRARAWSRFAAWAFGRDAVKESVSTRMRFEDRPEAVWTRLMFYEEVPDRPPLFLRFLLPIPVRSEGDKTRLGALIRCAYRGGDLLKRTTAIERPCLLKFVVIQQRLGIEKCIEALEGSYEIRESGKGSEVILTTNYRAYLRPRFLFRAAEKFLIGELHRHILRGMCVAMHGEAHAGPRFETQQEDAERRLTGAIPCTVSHCHSPR